MRHLFCLLIPFIFSFSNFSNSGISGTVTDADSGETLIAVLIAIEGAEKKGAVTDYDGNFKLPLEPGVYKITVSYTGYASQILSDIKVEADKFTNLTITMKTSGVLEEVVIRTSKVPLVEKDITTSGATLTSDYMAKMPTRSVNKIVETPSVAMYKSKSTDMPKMAAEPTIYFEDAKYETAKIAAAPPNDDDLPKSGQLTAGEWNDLHNWNTHWKDLLADEEIAEYQKQYSFFPKNRYSFAFANEQGFPLVDAPVRLLEESGEVLWQSRTDNAGRCEMWASLFDNQAFTKKIRVEVMLSKKAHTFENVKNFDAGTNYITLPFNCDAPTAAEILWVVDATGSMNDELSYLKAELLDVMNRVSQQNSDLNFRMGSIFYRDKGDNYVTRSSDLDTKFSKTVEFIQKQSADGGGDYPEAVHTALEEAIFKQKWSEKARTRICFLLLDASPHQEPEVIESIQKSIKAAAEKGIRLVPIAGSGIRKDTEFLMKFFGLATNGTYTFLTDHSGIGNKHIEPTSDEYLVESCNALIIRLINDYTVLENCEGKTNLRFEGDAQNQLTNFEVAYFPNPADTYFNVQNAEQLDRLTIFNSEGKAVKKMENLPEGLTRIETADLAAGIYTLQFVKQAAVVSGKLVVIGKN